MLVLCQMALASLLLGGCQRGPAPLTPVSGKVTFRGVALQTGTIVFTPDPSAGDRGPIAHGKINSDGSFHLFTGEAAGAPAGKYRVTVTAYANGGMQTPSQPFVTPYSILPDKYRDPELSGLACEIKPNRPNSFDIPLN